MDTEAIASEIVYLKNRISELDEGVERERLLERLRSLQDQLSAKSTEAAAGKTTLQYVKPS